MKGVISKSNPKAISALGTKIMTIRTSKRFSRAALAKAVGLSHVQLGNYEEGRSSPTEMNLSKIAQALGVTTDFLLNSDSKSNSNYSFDKWVDKAKNNLSDNDQLRVAEYIQLLCIKTESEKTSRILADYSGGLSR